MTFYNINIYRILTLYALFLLVGCSHTIYFYPETSIKEFIQKTSISRYSNNNEIDIHKTALNVIYLPKATIDNHIEHVIVRQKHGASSIEIKIHRFINVPRNYNYKQYSEQAVKLMPCYYKLEKNSLYICIIGERLALSIREESLTRWCCLEVTIPDDIQIIYKNELGISENDDGITYKQPSIDDIEKWDLL